MYRQVVDGAWFVVDRKIADVVAMLRHDLRKRATQRLGIRSPAPL